MAKVIMVQGTMSNAGKSLVTAGLCRVFNQDGKKVAPFKSQIWRLIPSLPRKVQKWDVPKLCRQKLLVLSLAC